jgi:hypothetical protein
MSWNDIIPFAIFSLSHGPIASNVLVYIINGLLNQARRMLSLLHDGFLVPILLTPHNGLLL